MGAGERNVTSGIYCINHNSLHWNDVFSIIAATEVDSKVGERFGGFKYFLTTKSTKISYLQIIFQTFTTIAIQFDHFCF